MIRAEGSGCISFLHRGSLLVPVSSLGQISQHLCQMLFSELVQIFEDISSVQSLGHV